MTKRYLGGRNDSMGAFGALGKEILRGWGGRLTNGM